MADVPPLPRRDDLVVVPLHRRTSIGLERTNLRGSCNHTIVMLGASSATKPSIICPMCLARWSSEPPPASEVNTCTVCGHPHDFINAACDSHELRAAALAMATTGDDKRHQRAALRYAACFLEALPGLSGSAAAEIVSLLRSFALVD